MIRLKRTIHDVLAAWGISQRTLPPRADALKEYALNRVVPVAYNEPELPRRLPWFSLALAGMAVIVFFLSSSRSIPYQTGFAPFVKKQSAVEESYDFAKDKAISPAFPPMSDRTPITDTREFIKTDYHARLRTREVATAWQRAQTLVRGMGGRVDAANVSDRFGYITFVVPADKFTAWRDELRTMAPLARFFTENISSQNLLPEKRNIEFQSDEVLSKLARLRSDRGALTRAYRGAISKLESRLATITTELAKLRGLVTDDAAEQAKNAAREQELIKEESALRARLKEENSSHNKKLAALNSQIGDAESQARELSEQDQSLRDTVATVAGTVSIEWISIWQVVGLYLPGSWLSWFLLAAAVVAHLYHRRRSQLVLP